MSEAATALSEAFVHDPSLYVRCDAALALGLLNSQDQLPLLIDRFTTENFEVRKRIVMAIAMMTGDEAQKAQSTLRHMLPNTEMTDKAREFLQSLLDEEPNSRHKEGST